MTTNSRKEHRINYYKKQKEKGICVNCNNAKATEGMTQCKKCREKYNKYQNRLSYLKPKIKYKKQLNATII